MYQFGPYSKTHATAGTFAFKKELLKQTRYNDETSLSEEKEFLKDYTIPFVQLDPQHTILVFSHIHNTFDKRKLLEDTYKNPFTKISDKTIDYFMNEEDIKEFFMVDIDDLLDNYEPGRAEMKPDVLKQMEKIEVIRKEIIAKRRISGNEVKPQQKTSLVQEQQMKRLFELHRTKIHELSEQIKLKDTIIQEQEKQIALLRK